MCPERPSCLLGPRVRVSESAGTGSEELRRREARSVPYRALGTSTGPRPPLPPPGPASTSPLYFSSIPGLRRRRRRRCPCRGVSSCLAAAAEQQTQGRHSPMAAASLVARAGQAAAAVVPETGSQTHARRARPRAVPAAPGSPESHRSGRCQATSSGPAALTPGGVPSSAPAHDRILAFPGPSLGPSHHVEGSNPRPLSAPPLRAYLSLQRHL